jgi:hypothetical protein
MGGLQLVVDEALPPWSRWRHLWAGRRKRAVGLQVHGYSTWLRDFSLVLQLTARDARLGSFDLFAAALSSEYGPPTPVALHRRQQPAPFDCFCSPSGDVQWFQHMPRCQRGACSASSLGYRAECPLLRVRAGLGGLSRYGADWQQP